MNRTRSVRRSSCLTNQIRPAAPLQIHAHFGDLDIADLDKGTVQMLLIDRLGQPE